MQKDNIRLGSEYHFEFRFDQNNVIDFAKASGDYNPIHLDEAYAEKTIFGRRILHGFLGGSVFSKVFGTLFPGNGTIYLKQNMSFFKPMFVETDYVAQFKVIEVDASKNRALVTTEIYDKDQQLIIGGDALIKHPSIQ